MRVVDSSAWIEWLTQGRAADQLRGEMPARTECVVPTIVQLELAKWFERERDDNAVDSFFAYTATCIIAPLDTALARRAAELSAKHKLALADAIIYATAELHDADVLTLDAHFKGLDRVVYFSREQ
jgi:predicted nucleic acid-binding protein